MIFNLKKFKFSCATSYKLQAISSSGQAALTAVIFFLVAATAIGIGFTTFAFEETITARRQLRAKQSYFLAEAGVEDVVYRLQTSKQVGASETLTVNGETVTTVITDVSGTKEIVGSGDVSSNIRKVKTVLKPGTSVVNFNYGIQVDQGGLEMSNNSRVEGSVFSNGNITGATGAVITGDALVAAGTLPSINQSWEVQNTDVLFGSSQGAIITTVDSAGSVGDYNSITVGSDGFARISYIDSTNDDLKFARCSNDNCTLAVLSVVDSAGSVDEVTSLVLGSDGFGRISYYHDGDDDLKFAQCTNADCSSRVLTIVDSANNTGDFSAIAMGSDGFGRIAFWYDTASDVRFVRCTNASCSSKVITNVETTGNIGEYIDLVLGSDGFGRMSYYNATNGDLKFTRCTNDDCTTKVITTVDSLGTVGQYTSIALGSDGFARISYYDSSNGDLKFARCTNDDCTTKVITTVDSLGTVGQYTSIALGSDGFARISYYDSSNGDLKFARCTNDDCTAKSTNTVDNASSVGKPSSLVLGSDGFGRMSSYASGLGDLRYVRCIDDPCTPPAVLVDIAQSFQPTITSRITHIDALLRKVGTPANAIVRIVRDSGGSPSISPSDILATGTLNASSVGTGYGWHTIYLTTTPILTANTTYWIVVDAASDNANYFYWGADSGAGYTRGSAKRSLDWAMGGWVSISSTDLDFRVYMGGVDRQIINTTVNGNARAHVMNNVSVGGNVNGYTYFNGMVTGTINANSISSCTINGNASYNVITSCAVGGTQTMPTVPPADLAPQSLPITQSIIDGWKAAAKSGGIITGNYSVTGDVSLGPTEITGNLLMTTNNKTLTVTGTIYVRGTITIDNGSTIRCAASFGHYSCIILTDEWIHIKNNGIFSGSGQPGSYIMLLSTSTCDGVSVTPPCDTAHHNAAIDLHNNATGSIFYAGYGLVNIHNGVDVTEVTGYKIHLDQNASVTYDSGLANALFSSGPAGGFDITTWREVE